MERAASATNPHPLRTVLHDGIHSRSRPPVRAPHRVSHISLPQPRRLPRPLPGAPVDRRVRHAVPAPGRSQFDAGPGPLRLERERHGEFDDRTVGGRDHPLRDRARVVPVRGRREGRRADRRGGRDRVRGAADPARRRPGDPVDPAAARRRVGAAPSGGPGRSSGAPPPASEPHRDRDVEPRGQVAVRADEAPIDAARRGMRACRRADARTSRHGPPCPRPLIPGPGAPTIAVHARGTP